MAKKITIGMKGKIVLVSVISIVLLVGITILSSCNTVKRSAPEQYLNDYVNVFAGNATVGHTSPCATTPFGMVKVGPESGLTSWKYCAGYQYTDTELYGFSQNRLNGTGCADLGDLHLFPFSGDWTKAEYKSAYNKNTEKGEPGYYTVRLEDAKVNAEMTCTPHVSIERFSFDDPTSANLLIDFQSGIIWDEKGFHKKIVSATQNFVDPYHITGNANTEAWAERWYYYDIEFDAPYTIKQELPLRDENEKAPRYILTFKLANKQPLNVKISISKKSIENAVSNIEKEMPNWDFDQVKDKTQNSWNEVLNRINVNADDEHKMLFYSSMYRLFEQPENISDVNETPFYSTLSLWDTFRAAHPLYTITSPENVNDFVNSMLDQYDKQGYLPIWPLWGYDTNTMIANHAVPVIVDAYLKGFNGFDANRAYEAIKTTLTVNHVDANWDLYNQYGYWPLDNIDQSASRTLECSYDDYCAALMAQKLGHKEDYEFFLNRSNNYKNIWDSSNMLMRAKDKNGKWREPFSGFDYYVPNTDREKRDFTEGNSWQYTWHVMQDIPGLIELFGGNDKFCEALDKFFTISHNYENPKDIPSDVTGLIGQYCQGNEPSHHVVYLYTLAGQPWKTQKLINEICKTRYHNGVDGLCGNEDCGQMSAWYIFSCLGFYPVNPCGGEYIIGAPQIEGATIDLGNGNKFVMKANNFGGDNIYVESVTWNGKEITDWKILHEQIMNGGELVFNMTSSHPNS